MLLRQFLMLGFPLVALLLEGLNLALEVAGLDVGLAESAEERVIVSAECSCRSGPTIP